MRLTELSAQLQSIGIADTTSAVLRLGQWIVKRELATEYRDNPDAVEAVVTEVAATAAVLARSAFHPVAESSYPLAIGASFGGRRDAAVPPDTVAAFDELAEALGLVRPSTGPLSNALFQLLLAELLKYLRENLPDIIDDLLNQNKQV